MSSNNRTADVATLGAVDPRYTAFAPAQQAAPVLPIGVRTWAPLPEDFVKVRDADAIMLMPHVPDDAFDYSDFYHYVSTSRHMRHLLGKIVRRDVFENALKNTMVQFAEDGDGPYTPVDENMRSIARWVLLED